MDTDTTQRIRSIMCRILTNHVPDAGFDARLCPSFWRKVFVEFHGTFPKGNDDPRWDDLFGFGFPQYRSLEEESEDTHSLEVRAAS